jgi:hypothetical protein
MAVNYTPEQYDNYARTLAGLSQKEAQAKVNQDRAFIESQGGMLNEQLVNAYVNPMITTAGNRDATNNQQLGGLTGADLQKVIGQAAYSAGSTDAINNAIRKNPQYLSEQALRQSYNLTQGDVNELISKGINFPQQPGMLTQTPPQPPTPPQAQPLGMLRPTTVPERFKGKSKEQIQALLQQDVTPPKTPDGSFNYVSPATKDLVGMNTAGIMGKLQKDVNPQAITVGGTTNTTSLQPTAGMLGKSSELLTGERSFDLYEPNAFSDEQITASANGDEKVLSDLYLNFNASGTDLTKLRPVVEQIAEQGFNSGTNNTNAGDAASYGVRAVGRAIMKSDYNNAVLLKDTKRAEQLQKAFNGTSDEAWSYFQKNYPENSAHEMFQKKFADPFGIGEPGKYQKTFLDKVGDTLKDITENPYVQAAVSFWNPAAGAVLNASATLNSGDKLTPMQAVAAVTGASDLMGSGAGASILKTLPQPVQDLFATIDDITNGLTKRVSASLSKLFPDSTEEELIAFGDALANAVKPVKDAVTEGGNFVANAAEPFKDASESFVADVGGKINSLIDGIELPDFNQGGAVSQQELIAGVAPNMGYVQGLPVNTDFSYNEPSLALQILQGKV